MIDPAAVVPASVLSRRTLFRLLATAAIGLALYVLFFHRLADRDLWSSHEARAAMNAQTILEDGTWGLPHLYDGKPELQKPPLYYWLVAGLGWLRGGVVDAWSVRLPATIAVVGCVVGTAAGRGVDGAVVRLGQSRNGWRAVPGVFLVSQHRARPGRWWAAQSSVVVLRTAICRRFPAVDSRTAAGGVLVPALVAR